MARPPRLALHRITRRFGRTTANDGIDLDVLPGEIHALLGENGAGKSTLVKIIYGMLQPDAGDIVWEGAPISVVDPNAARALGIGMVFQHFSLFETLTVVENIALGLRTREPLASLGARISATAARYGFAIDPTRTVHHLSVGERQRVEILRCLLQNPKLLIMDEPTSVLTPQEVDGLFAMLRGLAAEGCSILYISHKLAEIQALCDRATVLRAGRVVATCDPRTMSAAGLAELMIGAALPPAPARQARPPGRVLLEVTGLDLPAEDPLGTALADIKFSLRAGELLGIAGVAGNGQKELLAALAGERLAIAPDDITIDGRNCGHLRPAARRRLGLAAIPEERLGRSAVAELSLTENTLLTGRQPGFTSAGLIRFAALRAFARDVIAVFNVVAASEAVQAGTLSGGNMQKFIIGREVGQAPLVLIAAHPTWGVDVAAAQAIHGALRDLAATGVGIVLISEDLDEIFALCDMIAVLHAGRLSAPVAVHSMTAQSVGLLMGGMPHVA